MPPLKGEVPRRGGGVIPRDNGSPFSGEPAPQALRANPNLRVALCEPPGREVFGSAADSCPRAKSEAAMSRTVPGNSRIDGCKGRSEWTGHDRGNLSKGEATDKPHPAKGKQYGRETDQN